MSGIITCQKKPASSLSQQQTQSSFFVGSLTDEKKNNSENTSIALSVPISTTLSNPAKPKSKRCFTCNKKLTLPTEFLCKCSGVFCTNHRFPDSHKCTFNHKEQWKKNLEEKNPQVVAEKISKI